MDELTLEERTKLAAVLEERGVAVSGRRRRDASDAPELVALGSATTPGFARRGRGRYVVPLAEIRRAYRCAAAGYEPPGDLLVLRVLLFLKRGSVPRASADERSASTLAAYDALLKLVRVIAKLEEIAGSREVAITARETLAERETVTRTTITVPANALELVERVQRCMANARAAIDRSVRASPFPIAAECRSVRASSLPDRVTIVDALFRGFEADLRVSVGSVQRILDGVADENAGRGRAVTPSDAAAALTVALGGVTPRALADALAGRTKA